MQGMLIEFVGSAVNGVTDEEEAEDTTEHCEDKGYEDIISGGHLGYGLVL